MCESITRIQRTPLEMIFEISLIRFLIMHFPRISKKNKHSESKNE